MPDAESLAILPVSGLGEVAPGTDLARLIAEAPTGGPALRSGDVIVVTQKVVSKAEGRLVPLDHDDPEAKAALVARESLRIVRRRGELVISETRHGFVCANAGIDLSNVDDGTAALLPEDSDRSARRIRAGLQALLGVDVGVIVSDTFGRPWRRGVTDVAIGCAGVAAVVDLKGTLDAEVGSWWRPRSVWPTRSPRPPSWSWERTGAYRWPSCAGYRPPGCARRPSRTEVIRPPAEDLFR